TGGQTLALPIIVATPLVGRRVAAFGDAGVGQGTDVSGEGVTGRVEKTRRRAGEVEGAGQERCHLPSGDGIVRAEAVVSGRIATPSDPGVCQRRHRSEEHTSE